MSAARRLLPSRADAEDAVQETFVRALAAFPKIIEPQAAWLHTVLRNIAIDRLRRTQLESQYAQSATQPEGFSPGGSSSQRPLEALMEARSNCEAALRHLLARASGPMKLRRFCSPMCSNLTAMKSPASLARTKPPPVNFCIEREHERTAPTQPRMPMTITSHCAGARSRAANRPY